MGAHIAALLLRMFVLYFPQMIEAGMVFKAIPPLYSIGQGKKKRYFTENVDIVKYIQKSFVEKYTLLDLNKNKVSSKDLTIFFMRNADYNYHLEDVSDTYSVHRDLIESALYHYVQNNDKFVYEKLKKEIKSKFRFMDVVKIQNTIMIQGTINEKYTLFINDKLLYDARFVIDILKSNDSLYYYLDGVKSTIHTIMSLYDKAAPTSIQRYKGLGEMDADELAESTLLPDGDRTLIRYTLESAKDEIETIRQYESDPKKILGLVGNVTREDLLD